MPTLLAFVLLFTEPPAAAPVTAITNVTVIDGSSREPRPGRTVLLQQGKIAAVLEGGSELPATAEKIDGTGKFLIPGLWDMHTHIAHPDYLPLFIANGVTGVRELHNFFPDSLVAQRNSIAEGKLLGPRMKIAYALIDGPSPVWPGSLTAKDAEEGRAAVRKLKEKGADFVKVYTKLLPETYRAIAAEAKAVGLPLLGHVPEAVSAAEAAELGHRTMEHLYGLAVATSTEEKALRDELSQAVKLPGRSMFRSVSVIWAKARASHDEAKRHALFKLFKDKEVYHCPTLVVLRSLGSLDDAKFTADERVQFMPAYILNTWKGQATAAPHFRKLNDFDFRMIKELWKAEVPLLAGTDCSNPYAFPGFSIHDELELLVQHGLTPHEALKTATTNAVRCLGLEQQVGAIVAGQHADLILLEANPLDDIRNSKKIAEVYVNGKRFQRGQLDEMLAKVKANHRGSN